jgi:hypothetical protein
MAVLINVECLIIGGLRNLAQCKKKMGITNNEKWNTRNKSVFTMKLKFRFTDS